MALKRVQAGEEVSAEWANALIDALTPLWSITAAAPLEVSQDAAGVRLSLGVERGLEVFELSETLAQGDSARAKVLKLQADDWVVASEKELTVHDALEVFHGDTGKRGMAMWHVGSGKWVITQMEC
jgi:hypothetical protein